MAKVSVARKAQHFSKWGGFQLWENFSIDVFGGLAKKFGPNI